MFKGTSENMQLSGTGVGSSSYKRPESQSCLIKDKRSFIQSWILIHIFNSNEDIAICVSHNDFERPTVYVQQWCEQCYKYLSAALICIFSITTTKIQVL